MTTLLDEMKAALAAMERMREKMAWCWPITSPEVRSADAHITLLREAIVRQEGRADQ